MDRFRLNFTTNSLDVSVKVFKEQYSRTFSGTQEVFINHTGYVWPLAAINNTIYINLLL